MRTIVRFDCDMPGCTNRLDVPKELVANQDWSEDFEHGVMPETEATLALVGWFLIQFHGSFFLCPGHGTREQAEQAFLWMKVG